MTESKLYVWCGSLIRNLSIDDYRINTLEYMIDSVKEYYPEANIIISISALHHKLKNHKMFKRRDVTFIVHRRKKLQFEHLRLINKKMKFNDNDYIMFMDDDDMIIRHQEYKGMNVICGSQIYYTKKLLSTMNHHSFHEIKNNNNWQNKHWYYKHDFSGHIAKYQYIREYFDNQQLFGSSCEDVKFVQYLKQYANPIICDPFVFYRYDPYIKNKEWFNRQVNNRQNEVLILSCMLVVNMYFIYRLYKK